MQEPYQLVAKARHKVNSCLISEPDPDKLELSSVFTRVFQLKAIVGCAAVSGTIWDGDSLYLLYTDI